MFFYTVKDAANPQAAAQSATVTINVLPCPGPPPPVRPTVTAVSDTYTLACGEHGGTRMGI